MRMLGCCKYMNILRTVPAVSHTPHPRLLPLCSLSTSTDSKAGIHYCGNPGIHHTLSTLLALCFITTHGCHPLALWLLSTKKDCSSCRRRLVTSWLRLRLMIQLYPRSATIVHLGWWHAFSHLLVQSRASPPELVILSSSYPYNSSKNILSGNL